jgi:hypothetical protein
MSKYTVVLCVYSARIRQMVCNESSIQLTMHPRCIPNHTFPLCETLLTVFVHFRPGHGQANLTHPASINYNRDSALQTVRWAMVDWFKEEHRNGVWKVRVICLRVAGLDVNMK